MAHHDLTDVRTSDHYLDRYAASRDLWPGGTLDMWQGRSGELPDRVVWPANEAQLLAVLRQASEQGTPVVPYGAGSGVCGGARGRSGSIVLDTKAFDALGPVDEARWTVRAGAGVNGQQLEDYLQAHGFTLGHSPSSIGCSTVGGWAAARSAGQFSSRYGVFEDMVLGLRGVAPGPGVFSVGEGGDAPDDWLGLLLGSEGTLAVLTEAQLRIRPEPERRWLRGYRFSSVAAALRAMRRLMQAELWPAVVRLYDPVDTRIGGRTKPKKAGSHDRFYKRLLRRVDRLGAVRRRSLVLPLAMPALINQVFGRLSSGCLVIVGWEGQRAVVDALSSVGHKLLCEEGEDLGQAPGQRWYDSRHAVSFKLAPIFERGGFADTMEVAVRWSRLEDLYNTVRAAVSDHVVVMAHMSHVYPEGGSIYFSFAGQGERAVYDEVWRVALDAVASVGATVTHHHGVGALKAPWASREVGPAVQGWRDLKHQLDPAGVLNPGRLYVEVPWESAAAPAPLSAEDGLQRVAASASGEAQLAHAKTSQQETMFPWEQLPPPPRWQRLPWQVGWTEVAAEVDGVRCVLGRGPRSAAGSDLRPWLAAHAQASVTLPVVPEGARWMGESRPSAPWAVARDLLRGDLRPAVLSVDDGVLRVGFRGPAAAALGALASSWVPGGLAEVPYVAQVLPSGALERCEITNPDVVAVTPQGALRRKP